MRRLCLQAVLSLLGWFLESPPASRVRMASSALLSSGAPQLLTRLLLPLPPPPPPTPRAGRFAAGRIPTLRANYLLVKNIDVGGLQISDYRRRRPDLTAKCFAQIFELYELGKISPLPTEIIPLEQFAEGLGRVRDRSVRGRIVLTQDR